MNPSVDITDSILCHFDPVAVAEAEQVAMLRRIDTKFVTSANRLNELLLAWKENYDILEINGKRQLHYQTIYLDTPDFRCYKDHHNGKANRHKIRFRDYLDSSLTFFEIKRKIYGKETVKLRKKVSFLQRKLNDDLKDFLLKAGITDTAWEQKIANSFRRISLISHNRKERITIDTHLEFSNEHETISIPELVVIELKQESAVYRSDTLRSLQQLGIRPVNFSKYVTAVSLLEKTLKYNNLKPLHLKLQQLIEANADND